MSSHECKACIGKDSKMERIPLCLSQGAFQLWSKVEEKCIYVTATGEMTIGMGHINQPAHRPLIVQLDYTYISFCC